IMLVIISSRGNFRHPRRRRLFSKFVGRASLARLEDEYELKERAEALKPKLDTVVETARMLTDMIDVSRATRLEATVVILIMAEILLTLGQIIFWRHRGWSIRPRRASPPLAR
ncbi:MAG: hypothetical protein ACRED2_06240, partial [Methylocella sp.]